VKHTFIFIAEVQLVLSKDRQKIFAFKAIYDVFSGISQSVHNSLTVRRFPICHLLRCKRWHIGVQLTAFWKAKGGILQNNGKLTCVSFAV